ncbi:hypothetical protein [Caldicellulosiruptor morganii]|uniref:Uncharacterized protein n=1 Tax=Caldicellulosiruptor morganii TaxID=1387555 RepID=A0ABY7BPP9_9FIRM|nr:hypothetical protein [Caldicellulosiruptor morganii]WAM33750.1 hypothetical protein OTK00_002287 [Caldicellulosiruptor morganii]
MDSIPKDIIYFIPEYLENGDGVVILLLDGQKKVCTISIRSFVKKLYSMYAIDPVSIKRIISKKVGQKNLLPIVLPDATFIPVKTRKARVSTDPIFGYVNLTQIFKIDEKKEGFEILFRCGAVLKCFGSAKYFKRRITAATIISDYLSSMWAKGMCTIKEECDVENIFKFK